MTCAHRLIYLEDVLLPRCRIRAPLRVICRQVGHQSLQVLDAGPGHVDARPQANGEGLDRCGLPTLQRRSGGFPCAGLPSRPGKEALERWLPRVQSSLRRLAAARGTSASHGRRHRALRLRAADGGRHYRIRSWPFDSGQTAKVLVHHLWPQAVPPEELSELREVRPSPLQAQGGDVADKRLSKPIANYLKIPTFGDDVLSRVQLLEQCFDGPMLCDQLMRRMDSDAWYGAQIVAACKDTKVNKFFVAVTKAAKYIAKPHFLDGPTIGCTLMQKTNHPARAKRKRVKILSCYGVCTPAGHYSTTEALGFTGSLHCGYAHQV